MDGMSGLSQVDWIALGVYLLSITAIGLWSSRHVRSSADFFMPHRFGKTMMVTFAFGTGTSSDQAVTVASQTMTQGLSAIWWQWVWLPATPFYWLIAAIMRRFRAVTTADVYKLRYNQSVALLFAVVGILSLAAKIGLLLKGVGVMVDSCTGGAINETWSIMVVTILFVAYGMAGGLGAAIVTDFFQGLLTVLFSFLLLPFVLHAIGGISGMREIISGHNEQMLSLLVPGKIDWFFVLMYSVQALTGIVAFPFVLGVCSAGRTEMDGRVGFMCGNLLKRVCTMAWSLTALAAVAWYLDRGVELNTIQPDHLYGNVARSFLPQAFPGLLGVFLACLPGIHYELLRCHYGFIVSVVHGKRVPTLCTGAARLALHFRRTRGCITSRILRSCRCISCSRRHFSTRLLVSHLSHDGHHVLDWSSLAQGNTGWCLGRHTDWVRGVVVGDTNGIGGVDGEFPVGGELASRLERDAGPSRNSSPLGNPVLHD